MTFEEIPVGAEFVNIVRVSGAEGSHWRKLNTENVLHLCGNPDCFYSADEMKTRQRDYDFLIVEPSEETIP